ncbi:MAG TPA: redoxin domain-containing protein [Cyclobacteriaceae bacterium]|nr:redoxin domain-containing protein [Cyclobacteriaceae bacterium]
MKEVLISIFLLAVSVSACGVKDAKNPNQPAQTKTNDLPQIILTFPDHSKISAKDLEGQIILIFFQPDCDHCQREAKAISEHLNAFARYKIYFTTTEDFNAINQFANTYLLSDKTNIYFAQATLDEILNSVGPISAPSMFIYSDRKLVKHLDGETPIEEILKHL